jgi:uncharacterized membrane protein (UPF0136 family)
MYNQILVNILSFYGLFLITCGILSVTFIGPKAKTALISGGASGCISLGIAYLVLKNHYVAVYLGIGLSIMLFVVFSWRCTKTLFRLFEMIAGSHPELKVKGIAFLIIGLMAIVSLVVFIIQIGLL